MASKTSDVSVVTSGTGRNKRTDYYKTDVTTLADGSVKTETFRTDASGNNAEKIRESTTDKDGKTTTELTSNAREEEKRAFDDPNSQLSTSVNEQVGSVKEELKNETVDPVSDQTFDKASGGSGNTATTTDQSGTTAISSSDVPSDSGTRSEFYDEVYPEDLRTDDQDVIKFTMLEYVPQDFSTSTYGFSNQARLEQRTSLGSIILPAPGGLQDSNSVEWSGQKMNALEAAGAALALTGIQQGFTDMFKEAQNIANTISSNAGETKTAIANAFAGAAVGVGGQLLTRTTGAVINPNLELLFQGPTLRQFSFQFKLSARNDKESARIVRILRFFKQGSAPQKSNSHLFLKSPNTFRIQYLHKNTDNKFISRIKECALQSVAVNYTPEGNYATFDDGAMVSYELTLGFSELEPIFNDDYNEFDDTNIGY